MIIADEFHANKGIDTQLFQWIRQLKQINLLAAIFGLIRDTMVPFAKGPVGITLRHADVAFSHLGTP